MNATPCSFAEMHPLDQYILLRAADVTQDVREHYDTFTFHRLYQRLKDFCIVDLSAIYFDVLKDRLYTSAPKALMRRSAQTALWKLGNALVRLLAPVMSFTSDEVWGFLPAFAGKTRSVHLEHFPAADELTGELPQGFDVAAIRGNWETLLSVRDEALKALETARAEKQIGSGLEAQTPSCRTGERLSRAGSLSGSAAISVYRVRRRAGKIWRQQWRYWFEDHHQ